ncbi:universal stress protein [Klugiella xanthotipulae]|uniref:Nucleotide-binding universal stress UspA family protein n=1 Tax=Klugiella xanthotipulae TaxID=244735 RepID=A0A543HS60_9MICO|nr:universal stress protein [Klugiella xanthotipulae]TQM61145.1 nucleotide-binding universal stress UspA family protein [Klugiella xanthotipulae]
MTQRIIIGIDGSEPSRAALVWGMNRAHREGASVHLVHVVDDSFLSESPVFVGEARTAAERIAAEEKSVAEALGLDVPITTEVVIGNPAREIERLSTEASLIVLGTHKGAKVPAALFGTRGIKIAAVSHSPVAIIPLNDEAKRSGVVVGVDTSEASERAVQYAAAEADRTGQPLIAVYAWTPPVTPGLEYLWSEQLLTSQNETAEEAMAIALAGLSERYPDLVITKKIVQSPPIAALVAEGKNAQLLVVGNRGRSGLTRLLLGSVSHGVLNNISCPTLVARTE